MDALGMNAKEQLMTAARDEFDRWEAALASLTEDQITTPLVVDNLPIKDTIAHLWAWQQRTIARLQAAMHNTEPTYPNWPADLNPNEEADTNKINAWIYDTTHGETWSNVYHTWREGYLKMLELTDKLSEEELFTVGKYAWIGSNPLAYIIHASYEHHQEHLEQVLAWQHQTLGLTN